MKASPGVQWVMGYKEGLTLNLGTHEDSSLILYGGEMLSVDPLNGDIRWRQTISETIRNGALDKKEPQVYLLDLYGDLTAYHLTEPSNIAWTTELNTFSSAELIPLPGSGVFAADRRRAIVVDPDGDVLWEIEIPGIPVSWAYYDDGLVFTTSDLEKPLWMANENGIDAWDSKLTGQLVETGEDVYLYADDGIYRLDTDDKNAVRLIGLPGSIPKMRKLILLDNGDLVIVHVDGSDRRLIAFNPDGSQKWEHSIQNIPFGEWVLSHQSGVPYLFASHVSSTMAEIEIYEINMATGSLTHLFHGGNRQSYTRGVWISSMGDNLWLINIWGGPLVGFNPQIAAGIIE
jgi:outer membrane protein assembly factor BamB